MKFRLVATLIIISIEFQYDLTSNMFAMNEKLKTKVPTKVNVNPCQGPHRYVQNNYQWV